MLRSSELRDRGERCSNGVYGVVSRISESVEIQHAALTEMLPPQTRVVVASGESVFGHTTA